MIKAAIFDVDGTVLDSMWVWKKADEEYLKKLGIPFDEAVYNKMHTMTFETSVLYFCRAFNISLSPEKIKEDILSVLTDYYGKVIEPVKGVPELIKELYNRGVCLSVVTSNRRDLVNAAFERLGLHKYFSRIIICDEHGADKNDPRIFEYAAKLMNAEPCETAVFEDSPHAVETAKKAGFWTVHITKFDVSDENVRRELINSL